MQNEKIHCHSRAKRRGKDDRRKGIFGETYGMRLCGRGLVSGSQPLSVYAGNEEGRDGKYVLHV